MMFRQPFGHLKRIEIASGTDICEKMPPERCRGQDLGGGQRATLSNANSGGGAVTAENAPHGEKSGLAATALAAMGVVFGDIGTSPLYTVKEVFGGHHPLAVNPENVLSLIHI